MPFNVTVYSTKPTPMECPACGHEYDWFWDEDAWILNNEWWFDPQEMVGGQGFTCSARCYIQRLKEIDCDMGPVT